MHILPSMCHRSNAFGYCEPHNGGPSSVYSQSVTTQRTTQCTIWRYVRHIIYIVYSTGTPPRQWQLTLQGTNASLAMMIGFAFQHNRTSRQHLFPMTPLFVNVPASCMYVTSLDTDLHPPKHLATAYLSMPGSSIPGTRYYRSMYS